MTDKDEELEALGPFTLEEAKEWLHKLEDDAWIAKSQAAALDFILGNLLVELDRSGVMDAKQFVGRLQKLVPLLESSPQISAKVMLDQLQATLADGGSDGSGGYLLH